jgi:hypothetical protein
MAKKRYSPSIDAIPQRAVSTPVSRSSGGQQSSGYNEEAAGMYGLAKVLGGLNPALKNFSEGYTQSGEMQSPQYTSDMLQGVNKNAVAFKNILKKAGHSQWNNPHVYRNQIINIAEATAQRDVDSMEGNIDLLKGLEALTKRGGDDFRENAIALMQEYQPEERDVEKGAGGFWDMGYGQGYMKGRDALLEQYRAKNLMYQRRAVVDSFQENGRAKLGSFLKTKATLKNKSNPDYEKNFREFRDYISQMYNSYPEAGIGYTQSIFDTVIEPMFSDMARDPDSDGNLKQLWDKVMGMTRQLYDDKGEKAGQVSMFTKFDDISTREGIQTVANMWDQVAVTETKAYGQQTSRTAIRQGAIDGAAKVVLKHWPSWGGENEKLLQEYGIDPKTFDPFDEKNWPKLAEAVAEHDEFKISSSDSQHAHNRMLLDAFSSMRTMIYKDETASVEARGDKRKALMTMFAQNVQANPEVLASIQAEVKKAIGDPTLSTKGLAAKLASLSDVDKMRAEFHKKNPSITTSGFPFQKALRFWADEMVGAEAMEEGERTLLKANQVLANPAATQKELAQMDEEVRDAKVEINDTKLDGELTNLSGLLKKKLDIAPYFTLTDEDRDELIKNGLTIGDVPAEVVEILGHKAKLSQATASGMNGLDQITTDMWSASNAAFNSIIPQTLSIYADEVEKQFVEIGNVPDRERRMKSEGIPKAKEATAKRIALLKTALMNHYKDATAQSEKGQQKLEAKRASVMSSEARSDLAQLNALDADYAADRVHGGGGRTAGDIASKPEQSLEFTTGRAGGMRAEALATIKRRALERRKGLEEQVSALQLTWLKSKEDGSLPITQHLNSGRLAMGMQKLKTDIIAFEGVHFAKLLDPEGYEVTPVTLEGRSDANPLSIRIRLGTDSIDPRQVLIYESPEELHGLAEDLNELEGDIGKAQGMPGATAEWTDEDLANIAKDSPLLQQQAEFFRRTLNVDILAKNPAMRALAHTKLDEVNTKNAAMFMTRFPEKLPAGVIEARKFQTLERYANDQTIPTYQGITHTPAEKAFVSNVLASNKLMAESDMNTEEGITGAELITLMTASQGGADNINKYAYTITPPRAGRSPSISIPPLNKMSKEGPVTIDSGQSELRKGSIDRKRRSLGTLDRLLVTSGAAAETPDDPKDVLAQELAFASEGIHNPSSMGDRWQNREAINGWGNGILAGLGSGLAAILPKEVVENLLGTIGPDTKEERTTYSISSQTFSSKTIRTPANGDESTLYQDTRYLEINPEKIASITSRTEKFRALLDGKGDSPELAKAYNRWLLSEPDYFNGKFNKENVFDLKPLPIPTDSQLQSLRYQPER